jgi:hypothetical protein
LKSIKALLENKQKLEKRTVLLGWQQVVAIKKLNTKIVEIQKHKRSPYSSLIYLTPLVGNSIPLVKSGNFGGSTPRKRKGMSVLLPIRRELGKSFH